jgi:hypothetical protein
MAIAVNPAWIEFYEAVFDFQRLSAKTVANYSFVKGAPAVGAYIRLDDYAETLREIYKSSPAENNLYEYIFQHKFDNLQFPERKFSKITDPVLTPEIINYFFNQRTQTFASMSDREIFTLYQLYRDEHFRNILPPLPKSSNPLFIRADIRHEVNFSGQILLPGDLSIKIAVTDISQNGLCLVSDRGLRSDEAYKVKIEVDGIEYCLEKTQIAWSSPNGRSCGLKLTDPPTSWINLVSVLKNDLLRKVA